MTFWRRPAGRARRGFTLIEVVIVMAIIGIVAALGIPSMLRARRKAQLDNRVREFVAAIALAQSEAVAGRQLTGIVGGVTGPVRQAGIRFANETSYVVFVDNDADPTAFETIRSVNFQGGGSGVLTTNDQGFDVTIESATVGGATQAPPGGIEFRFGRDATIVGSNNVQVVLDDDELQRRAVIDVTLAGQATVTELRQ